MSCKGGCNCHNSTDYQPCVPEPICYNGCTSAPCAYDILSKCPTWPDGNFITRMRRHCLYDFSGAATASGQWSSRVNCAGTGTFPGGSAENPECAGEDVRPYNPTCGGQYIGDILLGCGQPPIFNGTSCSRCTWSVNDLLVTSPVWVLSIGGPPPGGYPPPGPTSGTTASLAVFIPDCSNPPGTLCQVASYVIVGSASDPEPGFSCNGRTSFRKQDSGTCFPDYRDVFNSLPDEICVVASASDWSHACGNTGEMCECKDDSCETFVVDAEITCLTTTEVPITFTRNGGYGEGCPALDNVPLPNGPVDLSGCISFPSASCGCFIGNFSGQYVECQGENRQLIPIAWCEAGTWTMQVWCVTWAAGGTIVACTLANEVTLDRLDTCDMQFAPVSIDVSGSVCCEPCGCPTCDLSGAPTTLNMDIIGPGNGSGSATRSGTVICGAINLDSFDRMSLRVDLSDCSASVGCNGTDCVDFNCFAGPPTVTVNSCDPLDITVTFTAGALACGACASGNYTAHIYE